MLTLNVLVSNVLVTCTPITFARTKTSLADYSHRLSLAITDNLALTEFYFKSMRLFSRSLKAARDAESTSSPSAPLFAALRIIVGQLNYRMCSENFLQNVVSDSVNLLSFIDDAFQAIRFLDNYEAADNLPKPVQQDISHDLITQSLLMELIIRGSSHLQHPWHHSDFNQLVTECDSKIHIKLVKHLLSISSVGGEL